MKSKKWKARFLVVEALRIELDELRVDSLVLGVAGKTEFILILVESLAFLNATRHFCVTRQAPFVVDLAIE